MGLQQIGHPAIDIYKYLPHASLASVNASGVLSVLREVFRFYAEAVKSGHKSELLQVKCVLNDTTRATAGLS